MAPAAIENCRYLLTFVTGVQPGVVKAAPGWREINLNQAPVLYVTR